MTDEKNAVLNTIHSILNGAKHGVPLDQIDHEYRGHMGISVPFRKFGYNNLRQMIDDAKSKFYVNTMPDGRVMVKAIPDNDSGHIAEMARRDKGKRNPNAKPAGRRPSYSQWQPPPSSSASFSSSPSSSSRHGFRPFNRQGGGNFRSLMGGSQRMPDQRNGSFGSGRFNGRLGGGMMQQSMTNFNGHQQRLRVPQNGQQQHQQPNRGGQTQANNRPISQRLGPMPNQNHSRPPTQSQPQSPPPATTPQPSNFIKILEDYFKQKELGSPEFGTSKIEMKQKSNSKRGVTRYYSTVKVNGQTFQTYPTDYSTEKEAEEAAAKLACQKLNLGQSVATVQSSGDNANNLPVFPADVNMDILIDRLFHLVGTRSNGVWSSHLEDEYRDKFGQGLPANWPEKVEQHQLQANVKHRLNVEKPIHGRFIIIPHMEPVTIEKVKPHVIPQTTAAIPQVPVPAPPSSTSTGAVPRNRVTALPAASNQPKPPELVLPEDNLWDVYVTHIFSAVEVCIRILGDQYSVKFEDLITDMELHYFNADKIPNVSQPIIGNIYAAMVESEWHRVEVVSVRGVFVTCYFIDHGGDHDVVSVDVLREIEPKFLALAPQAKRVRLAGLEPYANSPFAHKLLSDAAVARSLVGQVHSRKNDQDISMILIDTSGTELDININEMVLEKMKQSPEAALTPIIDVTSVFPNKNGSVAAQAATARTSSPPLVFDPKANGPFQPLIAPNIPQEGAYFDVIVTLAASPSNFTVQPYEDSVNLETLMASIKEFYSNENHHISLTLEDLNKDSYFAALHTDGIWYRVKINSQLDSTTMAVKIVDYGDFSMVPLENLQPLWPQFRTLPIQAINATLAGIVAVDGDWTVDDTVWFARRVVNNALVSVIKDIGIDSSEAGGLRLGLSLIDTNDPKADVIIEQELVESGRAVFFCI